MPEARRIETGTDRLLAHADGAVGWLVYSNEGRLNALTMDMIAAVPGTLAAFDADPGIRVVVVTGAGERAFIAGADVSEFGAQRASADGRARYDKALTDSWRAWDGVAKPVIAMIRGHCVGGGVITAMKADIRVAADDTRFVLPAARLGLGYGFAGVQELLALVGPAWTAEMISSARRISAEEALRMRLVNRVVPAAELEGQVRDLAGAIAANAPLTITAVKAAIRQARREPATRDLSGVDALVEECFRSDDYREGQRAFLEKRPPVFRGR